MYGRGEWTHESRSERVKNASFFSSLVAAGNATVIWALSIAAVAAVLAECVAHMLRRTRVVPRELGLSSLWGEGFFVF